MGRAKPLNAPRLLLRIDGRPVPLHVRRSERATRIQLRMDLKSGSPVLVLPRYASIERGFEFARDKRDWIGEQIALQPETIPFEPGEVIPYRGRDHVIIHRKRPRTPGRRGEIWREPGAIYVAGDEDMVASRVETFLKFEARNEIHRRALEKSDMTGKRVRRVTLRDPKGRWGSCTSDGNLSFSWRLIMAPVHVLDYVIAHEVAHLTHMNHGPNFWRLVSELTHQRDPARDWLRVNGIRLHRYG
jgi:predicted metal-dependent hydrolase